MITQEKPRITCRLERHAQGAFEIDGEKYRPEWGRSEDMDKKEALSIVALVINEAKKLYEGTRTKLGRVRVTRYEDGRTRIVMRDQ